MSRYSFEYYFCSIILYFFIIKFKFIINERVRLIGYYNLILSEYYSLSSLWTGIWSQSGKEVKLTLFFLNLVLFRLFLFIEILILFNYFFFSLIGNQVLLSFHICMILCQRERCFCSTNRQFNRSFIRRLIFRLYFSISLCNDAYRGDLYDMKDQKNYHNYQS